jgi:hypothetical protein
LVECISAKELHTQAPTALDIGKIKYSPQAYPISGTSPHCGHGFKSSIVTTSVAGVLLKCGGGLCHNALDARARHDFAVVMRRADLACALFAGSANLRRFYKLFKRQGFHSFQPPLPVRISAGYYNKDFYKCRFSDTGNSSNSRDGDRS